LRHDLAAERGEYVGGVFHVWLPEGNPNLVQRCRSATEAILFS
jgi:hypothetical protein